MKQRAPNAPRRPPHPGETARSRQGVEPGSDGDLIARCRHRLNLSVRSLSEMLGADKRTISRWEAGEYQAPAIVWIGLFLLLYLQLDGVSKATAQRYYGHWRQGVADLLATSGGLSNLLASADRSA
jgi:ribosome-binding protein aMBF1 (putative translation factor)